LTNLFFSMIGAGNHPLSKTVEERPRPQDADVLRRNGETLPVSISASPVAETAESERLVSFVSRAELDQPDESLLHAQRLAGIGTLTTSVAHELTNPIGIIAASCANLLDVLKEETVDREELVQAIELIEQSAFRCARIVELLHNYAYNIDQTDGENEAIAVTSPAAIVQDALMMVEQQFRKRASVSIESELQEDLATIFCDHHRITQVLNNLLIYARDAMQPDGGTVKVRFWTPSPAQESALAGCTRPSQNQRGKDSPVTADLFAFSVADSGTGIAPEIMEKIFEPFFTTKPNGQGTGLGLFIARGIVAQHGGCIYARNNDTRGATFTVVLPRRQSAVSGVQ
jgi:two-component system cell cycle sensor histidine kinase/response regulator CckA